MGKSDAKAKKAERAAAARADVHFEDHTWSLEKLEEFYSTSIEKGLTSEQAAENREKFGSNALTPPEKVPEWLKFLHQFTNFFALLLIGGSLLCYIGFGIDTERPRDKSNLYLGIVLDIVVLITGIFSYMQEAKSEKIMEGFKNMIPKRCKVLRDGQIAEMEATDLVKGDVVFFNEGDQIPADLRVVQSTELKVDNSSLTGEPEPQERGPDLEIGEDGKPVTQVMEAANVVFYTTLVNSGGGKGVVIGTGDETVMGQIANLATETSMDETPIAKEIHNFIMIISAIAIFLGVSFFIIALLLGTSFIKSVILLISIIVANVPEGLLVTVTVSLALTAQRMHEKNVLVKKLEAVETLGSTTVIASDKTGTLTQNRMTIRHCWYNNKVVRTPSGKNRPHFRALMAEESEEPLVELEDPTFKKLQAIATLSNNSSFITKTGDGEGNSLDLAAEMENEDFNLLGLQCTSDASEAGMVKFVNCIRDVEEYRAACPKKFEIKFNSTNKWALSIHAPEGGKKPDELYLKGAPERVIKMCTKIMVNGKEEKLTDEWLGKFNAAYEEIGALGERVLGFAYRSMKDHAADFEYKNKPKPNFKTDDLTFVGFMSLIDPPREGVPEAVQKCKDASIKVFMVTGDHPITAEAIAKSVGIIDQDKLDAGKACVVKGDDIRDILAIEDEAAQSVRWDDILGHDQIVFARVSPAHKLIICEQAQLRKEIVAVTGDGVNDAPALKKADIGIAMGIMGKDVSKEAADMILMDDNFASIVNGVEEGRLIFDNLKKSISYTLTSNIPEIGPFLCYITINIPLPLSTFLILCVDLGTDMVPAISMAHEKKESDIMQRPPRNAATDRLVNRRLIFFAYFQIGIMQVLSGFFTYMTVLNDYGYAPRILMNTGLEWDKHSLMCTVNAEGRAGTCGYGCGRPAWPEDLPSAEEYCREGCNIPRAGMADAFSEFTADGFRGFQDGVEAACGRSCEWFRAHSSKTGDDGEDALLATYCDSADANGWAGEFGFKGREEASEFKRSRADRGAFYWWNGGPQLFPNVDYQQSALEYAQTAYFISIIVVQWADLIISKTRKLSVFDQGMGNRFMNFGLFFETALGCLLIYVPVFNDGLFTRPIHILHWCPGIPWSIMIFVYDEVRKYIIRKDPGGWIERFTYW